MILQVIRDGVEQGACVVTTTGMNDHPCRLINHHQIVIFIHHLNGDILRLDGKVDGLMVKQHLHDIQRFDLIIGFYRFSIYPEMTGIGCSLNAVSGRTAHVLHHKLIHT